MQKCSNSNNPFALAGVVVIFLLIVKVTVAVETINGLNSDSTLGHSVVYRAQPTIIFCFTL